MHASEIKAKAHQVMLTNPACVFATVDSQNAPHQRMMQTLAVDDDGTVFFSTARGSRKAQHLAENGALSLLYTSYKGDFGNWECAVLTGTAVVTDDKALRERFWIPEFTHYYPGGLNDPSYTVIVFKPIDVRYSSSKTMAEFAAIS